MATIAATHTVVKSRPATGRFGAGLFRFNHYAVTAPGFVEPSDDDRAAVGALFADESEPDYDAMAAEAEWYRQCESLTPPPGVCRSCGEPAEDLNRSGWCDRCDAMIDAHTDSKY